MALTSASQFKQAVSTVQSVLVVMRPSPSVDEIVASLAIASNLRRSDKQVRVVSENFASPSALSFLPSVAEIKPTIGQLQDFTISIQLPSDGLETVHHEIIDGKLVIKVTPKSGTLSAQNLGTTQSPFRFDAIIVVGAQDLNSLGAPYSQNTALFNAVPVIAIDYSPANEQFGHINLVDITLSSVCEVVYALFSENNEQITQPTAQLLLTGMIAATQSFKTRAVNARTLQTASALISLGADRELTVHNLFRQRTVAALKLWGAALSHLQSDAQQPLMWSTLTREDFARAGAAESDLQDLMSELIHTAPHAKVFALIFEHPTNLGEVVITIDAQRPYNAQRLVSGFVGWTGTADQTTVRIPNTTLSDVLQKVSNVLRAKMRE